MLKSAVSIVVMALASTMTHATQQDQEIQTVQVDGIREPATRSYRAFLAGKEAFERFRSLAPTVSGLQFRVIERGNPDNAGEGLALSIVDSDQSTPIPISSDGRFQIPQDDRASAADARLVFNRNKTHIPVIIPELLSPGLLKNVRRLGDLRLECRVQAAIFEHEVTFWLTVAGLALGTSDGCKKISSKNGYQALSMRKISHAC